MARQVFDLPVSGVPRVLPSLLLCDFGNLERELGLLQEASVAALHLDVMDGVFVPNFTYGMPIVSAIRRLTKVPLDVHLMIADPDRYVDAFADAGADLLTVHIEAIEDPTKTLRRIRATGMRAGLALNPDTPLDAILPHAADWDLILVMSVQAGFGGQKFQPVALEKLATLRARLPASTLLEVDGGLNGDTVAPCARAGANLLVVGSAIFRSSDYRQAIHDLERLASSS